MITVLQYLGLGIHRDEITDMHTEAHQIPLRLADLVDAQFEVLPVRGLLVDLVRQRYGRRP